MIRLLIAVVVGSVVAMGLVSLAEFASSMMWPPPAGLDPNNPEQMKQIAVQMPLGALIAVLAGWTLGALGGSAVSVLIARRRGLAGLITGALFVAVTVYMLIVIPGPTWFRVAAVVLELAAIAAAVRTLSRPGPGVPGKAAEAGAA